MTMEGQIEMGDVSGKHVGEERKTREGDYPSNRTEKGN